LLLAVLWYNWESEVNAENADFICVFRDIVIVL